MLSERYKGDGIATIELNDIQKKYLDEFRKKWNSGVYQRENFSCECGNTKEFEVLGEKDRYGLPVMTVICKHCGLVMTNPRMTADSYDRFYASEYPLIYRAISKPDDHYFLNRVAYGHSVVDFIEEKGKSCGKEVLEIGCAGGGIVKAFEERGYHALGVDLSPSYIEFGKSKGVNVRCCHSGKLLKENKVYDIIILNHVLEHFTDLKNELEIVRKLLNPQGGLLFVAVPGIKNLLFSYCNDFLQFLQNAHVYHFTQDTLVQTLKLHGFDVVYANEKVEALFCIGKKADIIDNYYEDILTFLRNLEVHREDVSSMIFDRIRNLVSQYAKQEVVIYGTGKAADKLLDALGNMSQIKGFLTKTSLEVKSYRGYPILDVTHLQGVKCIVISSGTYGKEIYNRIKYLEKEGIVIKFVYEYS